MELEDLRILKAVVEAGGISHAAKQLHRVQSNVTTRIRQLEDKLGVSLFSREGNRLQLLPAGQTLLNYAHRLLALADEACGALHATGPRGTLRLGAMESTAAVRLPVPLSAYVRQYPDVKLVLKTGNPQYLAKAVLAGELDGALVTRPMASGPLEACPVYSEELVIVSRAGQAFADPQNQGLPINLVAFEPGCPYRARFEAWLLERGNTPSQTIEITSYHAMLGCVAIGMGVSMVPRGVLSTFPDREQLHIHALPEGDAHMPIDLVWRRGAKSPNIQALIEVLVQEAPGAIVRTGY
ncbi:MAG: LysR substrate-binding domain-containing protein [Rhodoferax sp.]|nr:LysR family transcriptional regulator [Rhodoferax sp.]MDP3650187.1 LysR substrate-binding domain-containing protein [Rhodoferax sp.]